MMTWRPPQGVIVYVLAALCTLLPLAGQFYGDARSGVSAIDFRAYYCAALAARDHADPYRVEPLRSCEANTPAPFYRPPTGVAVPAPYPPYALAFMTPFTFVPFQTAFAFWFILMAISCAAAIIALAKVSDFPPMITWALFALSLGLESLTSGNVVPLSLAALLVAAVIAKQMRARTASVAIGVAMIEPHIALPAAIALFIVSRSSRPNLLLIGGLFAVVSGAFSGVPTVIEYLTQVLPAHALAEVSRDNQYSLATVVAALGASDQFAVFVGNLSYLLMTGIGIIVALNLTQRFNNRAFAVLLPPAFALLGGIFVHTVELAAAIPLCVLLYQHVRSQRRMIVVAMILLAIPWMGATSLSLFLAPLFPAAYLADKLFEDHERTNPLVVALASFSVILLLFVLAAFPFGGAHLHATHPPIDPNLAEASWRALVLGNTTNSPIMWLLRIPSWIGLVLAVGIASRAALVSEHGALFEHA